MSPRLIGLRAAFTLVELLVVIGIIGVLIAILLPSLHQARQSALRTKTLSNLRQIGLAVAAYESQNKGYWPTDLDDANREGRAFGGLALLVYQHKLPLAVLLNPNSDDTPARSKTSEGWPVLAELDGLPISLTSPATIDASNIGRVSFHCSFAYDHEAKKSGRKGKTRVYIGDRADYTRGRSFSAHWGGKGLCLLWTDQHAAFVSSKAIQEQQDPNVYHHNQYFDDDGSHPGEGGAEKCDGVEVTPTTLDTHLRFFSEEEDDALLPHD